MVTDNAFMQSSVETVRTGDIRWQLLESQLCDTFVTCAALSGLVT